MFGQIEKLSGRGKPTARQTDSLAESQTEIYSAHLTKSGRDGTRNLKDCWLMAMCFMEREKEGKGELDGRGGARRGGGKIKGKGEWVKIPKEKGFSKP